MLPSAFKFDRNGLLISPILANQRDIHYNDAVTLPVAYGQSNQSACYANTRTNQLQRANSTRSASIRERDREVPKSSLN